MLPGCWVLPVGCLFFFFFLTKGKLYFCLRWTALDLAHVFFLIFLLILCEYSCFTMLCYVLLYSKMNQLYVYMCAGLSCSVVSDCLWPHGLQPARCFCPWGFSRQEYWSGLPCPPPEDLPNPGLDPRFPALQPDSLPSEPLGKPKNTEVGSLLQATLDLQADSS